MSLDTTLLDLDRIPTPDELKALFEKHDWSAAKISVPQSRDADKVAEMNEIKKIMDAEFEKLACCFTELCTFLSALIFLHASLLNAVFAVNPENEDKIN